MMRVLSLLVATAVIGMAWTTTRAQTSVTRPEATIFAMEAEKVSIQGGVSHTFESGFKDSDLGDISSTSLGMVVTLPIKLNESFRLQTGLAYERFEFGSLQTTTIPDYMQGVSAVIGLEYLIQGKPAFFLRASPGLYFIDSAGSDSFDIPTVFGGAYKFSDNFILLYGATYAGMREYPILPVIGFLWDITEDIQFNLAFPRPGLTYKIDEHMQLSLFAEYRGLSVDTDDDVEDPRFADTELSYRELAGGVSFTYSFNEDIRLSVSAGYTFQRRFRYDSPERSFRSDGAPFVGMIFRGRF